MKFKKVTNPSFEQTKKGQKRIARFNQLLLELESWDLSADVEKRISQEVDDLNQISEEKQFKKNLSSSQKRVLKSLEEQMGLVPKNHYTIRYMIYGMTAFGVPIGAVFIGLLDNGAAFMGVGIGIGMAIGIAIGASKDAQAAATGKQINWEAND